MQRVEFNFNAAKNLDILSHNIFITTRSASKVNIVATSWGAIGLMWKLPVFCGMLRKSSYTLELIEKTREFSVTFPYVDMSHAAAACWRLSGRNNDKLSLCRLRTRPARQIATPVLDVTGMHYECQVIYIRMMSAEKLDHAIRELWYDRQQDNYHAFVVAQVVSSYITP